VNIQSLFVCLLHFGMYISIDSFFGMEWWGNTHKHKSWIDMGEKRNSYIPARPDEYYGRLGQWISWAHFLGLNEEQDENGSS